MKKECGFKLDTKLDVGALCKKTEDKTYHNGVIVRVYESCAANAEMGGCKKDKK